MVATCTCIIIIRYVLLIVKSAHSWWLLWWLNTPVIASPGPASNLNGLSQSFTWSEILQAWLCIHQQSSTWTSTFCLHTWCLHTLRLHWCIRCGRVCQMSLDFEPESRCRSWKEIERNQNMILAVHDIHAHGCVVHYIYMYMYMYTRTVSLWKFGTKFKKNGSLAVCLCNHH